MTDYYLGNGVIHTRAGCAKECRPITQEKAMELHSHKTGEVHPFCDKCSDHMQWHPSTMTLEHVDEHGLSFENGTDERVVNEISRIICYLDEPVTATELLEWIEDR
jgi:hypothetical protein